MDSTFFLGPHWSFLGHFRLKCGPKKVDSKKKVAFLVIFLGHFLTKMRTEKSGLPPQQFFKKLCNETREEILV